MGRRCGLCHHTVAVATLCSSCVHDVIKEVRLPPPAVFSSENPHLLSGETEVYANAIATEQAHARVRLLKAQVASWERRLSAAVASTAQRQEAIAARRRRVERLDESQKKELKALVGLNVQGEKLAKRLEKIEKKRVDLLRARILQILSDFQIKVMPCGKAKTFTICGWSPDNPNDKERTASVEAAQRVLKLV